MNADDELTCPNCREKFRKSESTWTVCLTCGVIDPPGGSGLAGHGPGPGAGNDPDRPDPAFWGECCTCLRVYTEEDALAEQDDVRTETAAKYHDAGETPPWERDDWTEPWIPGDESGDSA